MPMRRGLRAILLFFPAMRCSNGGHHTKDIVPRLSLHERFVREHTPVPTNVIEAPTGLPVFIAEPIPGIFYDVDLSVRRVRQAMPACLVVCSGSEYFAIVLG